MTINSTSKIDFAEFKSVMKDLTFEDILPVVLSTIDFLKDFGEFAKGVGTIQKKSERASEMIFKIGEEPEAFLALLVYKIPQEKLKPLVELTLKLSSVQTRMKEFKNLNADEKILLGEEFKQIATELSKMLKQVKQ